MILGHLKDLGLSFCSYLKESRFMGENNTLSALQWVLVKGAGVQNRRFRKLRFKFKKAAQKIIVWTEKMCWRLRNKTTNLLAHTYSRHTAAGLDSCLGTAVLILCCLGWWVWVIGKYLIRVCARTMHSDPMMVPCSTIKQVKEKAGKEDYTLWKGKHQWNQETWMIAGFNALE